MVHHDREAVVLQKAVCDRGRLPEIQGAAQLLAVAIRVDIGLAIVHRTAEGPLDENRSDVEAPGQAEVGLAGVSNGVDGDAQVGPRRENVFEHLGRVEKDLEIDVDTAFLFTPE